MQGLKIDADAESAVQMLMDNADLKVTITRLFVIEMEKI